MNLLTDMEDVIKAYLDMEDKGFKDGTFVTNECKASNIMNILGKNGALSQYIEEPYEVTD